MISDTREEIVVGPRGFAGAYAAGHVGHDEMLEADGSLRPHWRMLVSLLDDFGAEGVRRRWEQGRQLLRENGVTHNVYGDPNGLDRPWNLDLIPLLIPLSEWRGVSDGLVQRARLLNLLLADLYGPARSVSEGWLPPDLLFGNPAFLRACQGVALPGGEWLHLYAADFVRMGDGQFRVVSDRTQAPSGAGYSLENRIVISSILPTAFRGAHVRRLAPFFIALRQTLRSLAQPNRENPRIVLLTPGPYNETYFEHAYLARYLGYTLVQGNDLTVRDGIVFLKTLSGLQRVDVILRRVDDDYCDPLELYQHSFLGVPGLVEAVRQGNVAVANGLGSALVQAPAFLPFLPNLCRRLLGEDLKLQSVQTWWCGERDALRYVLDNLSRLVVKPAFPRRSDPKFGGEMSKAELEQLADRVRARPGEFVAQEPVVSWTAPVLMEDHAEARRFVVRAYAVAEGDSYAVMSGALTRATSSLESRFVSMQRGGGSKDTWILGDGPVNEPSLLVAASQPIELSRGGGELTSRVADDLFWLGRYVQRFEADVRIARGLFGRLIDQGRPGNLPAAGVLARALFGPLGFRFDENVTDGVVGAVFDSTGPGGLRRDMADVRALVRGLRDRISADGLRILQNVENELRDFGSGPASGSANGAGDASGNGSADGSGGTMDARPIGRVIQLMNKITIDLLAFGGVVAESMTRTQGWRFLDLGIRVERAIAVARLLRGTLVKVDVNEPAMLDAVLEIADSSLTYRRRYLTHLETPAVVDLLVGDETNPRSILFQIAAIEEHLDQLPRETGHPMHWPDKQAALRLRTRLKLAEFRVVCQPAGQSRVRLGSLLSTVIDSLAKISQSIGQIYFSHANVMPTIQGGDEDRST